AFKVRIVERLDANDAPVGGFACLPLQDDARDHRDDFFQIFEHQMLPYPHDMPSFGLELKRLASVPLDVHPQFLLPESFIPARAHVVLGTAMPEASVDENNNMG